MPASAPAISLDDVSRWHSKLEVPDPVTFVMGRRWLNRPTIYPRQGTLLKIIFLRDDLFTEYDHFVIGQWIERFDADDKDAHFGITPDIYERITALKAQGAPWFREILLAIGRRGGKGHVCALAIAYVIWTEMAMGSPQEFFGIDPDKQLHTLIYATKKETAKTNLYGDVYAVITSAPCFGPWLARPLTDTLSVWAPADAVRQAARSVMVGKDMATFQIVPKEATETAGRGVAANILGIDESAHITKTNSSTDADSIYKSSQPALGQLGLYQFIVQPSSTWGQDGLFYTSYLAALEQDEGRSDEGENLPAAPAHPHLLMLRLASWEIYYDWDISARVPVFPDDFTGDLGEYEEAPPPQHYARQRSAPAVLDEAMRAEQRRDPDAFRVERESHWATSQLAYLNPLMVRQMFSAWYDRPPEYGPPELTMQDTGRNAMAFYAHGDPSEVDHRFGFAMAHLEVLRPMEQTLVAQILAQLMADPSQEPDGAGRVRLHSVPPAARLALPEHHVVFDLICYWEPRDFPTGHIHYPTVMDWIFENVILKFRPRDITFDHFNVPSTVDYLADKIRENRPRLGGQRVDVHVRNATNQLNWDTYENFKAALNQQLVHAPWHQEGHDELKYLTKPNPSTKKVCAPDTGPVTTDDIADAIAITVWKLLDANAPYMAKGLAITPHAGLQGGPDPMARMSPFSEDAMAAVRGQFSASRPRAGALPSQGVIRSGSASARGLRPEMTRPLGRRNPMTGWR